MIHPRFSLKGQVYFLPKGIGYSEVVRAVRENHIGATWPESYMSTAELMAAKPFKPTIVTESVYLIGLYDRLNVFEWSAEFKRWRNPDMQTYGADIGYLQHHFFNNPSSIPLRVLSNEAANDFLKKLKKRYKNLQ